MDYGNRNSKAYAMKNNYGMSILSMDVNRVWNSFIDVSENGLVHIDGRYISRRNHVVLRNTKYLMGKTRIELREEDLNKNIYGTDVLFDEYDKPYFHCLTNYDNNGNPVYRDVYPEEVFGTILGEMKIAASIQAEVEMTSCCLTIPFNTSDSTHKTNNEWLLIN